MEYSEDLLKKMVQCGTLGYPVSKIINVFDVENEEQFIKDFENPKSVLMKHYQKGVDKADFIIDSKLFDQAKDGDLRALKVYEERKAIQLKEKAKEKDEYFFKDKMY